MKLCCVCMKNPREGSLLCRSCGKSYDQDREMGDCTVAGIVIWAAKRARRFERARKGKKR